MLNGPAQALVLSAALAVIGALVGIPSAVTEFPLSVLLLALPLALCLGIRALHPPELPRPSIGQVLLETAAVWTGYAVAFHLYHGFWDGQGIGIGLVGFVVTSPIVYILVRRRFPAPAAGQAAKPRAMDYSGGSK